MTRRFHPYLLSAAITAGADAVELPRMFSDHGVLQQGSVVPVWGWGNPGENITVEFGGQKVTAKADAKGEWRIDFDHAQGLKSRDGGPLKRFEIAGADGKWYWADAVIEGGSVTVSHSEVPQPVAVRYAWASNPAGANLVNAEGLPASLFRTDD